MTTEPTDPAEHVAAIVRDVIAQQNAHGLTPDTEAILTWVVAERVPQEQRPAVETQARTLLDLPPSTP
jgi:hypothetical protein